MTEYNKTADESVGAIWSKVSKNGAEYLTISLTISGEKHQFVAFKNTRKTADNQPDYRILVSKPRAT